MLAVMSSLDIWWATTEEKLKDRWATIEKKLKERLSGRRNIFIVFGAALVGLCMCLFLTMVAGSAGGNEDTPGTIDYSRVPTLVPQAAIFLPATNTPRPTDVTYATVTPAPVYSGSESEGVGLPHPPGDLARVIQVVDGESIDAEINGTTYQVRYIGLKAPEQGAPYYQEAINANAALVSGKDVILVKDVSEIDQFDRLLRYVYLTDGTFVNAELVKQGHAEAVAQPPDMLHHDEFVQHQQASQSSGLGIWSSQAGLLVTPEGTQVP